MTSVEWIATVAAIIVGAVFVVAGASKIAVGDQWTNGATNLGVPRWVSSIVPWAELVVGAFLIVGTIAGTSDPSAPAGSSWPAWAALAMLAAFTVVLVRAVVTRDPTPCNCFGTRSQAPVGPMHLVRNAALIALTLLALLR